MDIRRRTLLLSSLCAGTLGLPAAGMARQAAPAGISAADFLELSARITGYPAPSLDTGMAARLQQQLHEQGEATALSALLHNENSQPALAARLRAAWFAGLLPDGGQSLFIGFHGALAWSAAPFLHVPGSCGGATGYWSLPPEA